MIKKLGLVLVTIVALALFVPGAKADSVNFEDQPAGPCCFASAGPAQTLSYTFGDGVSATFTGGVILTGESNQTTDNSNVYATANFGDGSLTNPLVVSFNQPIVNFQMDILNALAGTYIMSDNVGDSLTFTLATTGGSIQTEGFAAAGTKVTIAYLGGEGGFDFAIDNVLFNQPLTTSTPEPGSMMLLGVGIVGLAALKFAKR